MCAPSREVILSREYHLICYHFLKVSLLTYKLKYSYSNKYFAEYIMFTEIRCLKLNFDNVNWFNSTSNHAKLYLLWPDRGVLDSFFSGMISSNRSTNLLSWPQGLVARCTTKADLSVLRLGTRSGRGVAFFPGVCSAIWNKQIKWYVLDSFVCKSDSWINSAKHHVGEWGWRSIKVHPRWD